MTFAAWDISDQIQIRHVKKFDDSINDIVKKYFDNTYPILQWKNTINEKDKYLLNDLNKNIEGKKCIDIGIYNDDNLIGWSYGWQGGMEAGTYYMANSCVIPEFRRMGLYSKMLEKVLSISKELGFQTVTSRHVAANNDVIIAKLKLGFKISGVEFSEIHGNLVHLTYFHNPLRNETFDVRSGLKKPKHIEIKKLFDIS